MHTETRVTDSEHITVHSMQLSPFQAPADVVIGQSDRIKLLQRDHAGLPPGNPRYLKVTSSDFMVTTTMKSLDVSHAPMLTPKPSHVGDGSVK